MFWNITILNFLEKVYCRIFILYIGQAINLIIIAFINISFWVNPLISLIERHPLPISISTPLLNYPKTPCFLKFSGFSAYVVVSNKTHTLCQIII